MTTKSLSAVILVILVVAADCRVATSAALVGTLKNGTSIDIPPATAD
jgi:hypothetical protein